MKKLRQSKKLRSEIWYQSNHDVLSSQYDYNNQKLFIEESKSLLNEIYMLYDTYIMKFSIDDKSVKKCVWMLQIDVLDTIRDCIYLIEVKKHRLVGKMFRDIVETLDIAHLIKEKPNKYLVKWYNNEFISHSEYRKYLEKCGRTKEKEESKRIYKKLSFWTHNTYFALLDSYSLGSEDKLVYDSHCPDLLILPQTISQYLFMLNTLIKRFIDEMAYSELFDENMLVDFKCKNIFKQ